MAVVFTDDFTVGSDTALESYGDWNQVFGGNNLLVVADDDRVEVEASVDIGYYNDNASNPTDDMDCTINGRLSGTSDYISVGYLDASGNGYTASIHVDTNVALEIYEWASGSPTQLDYSTSTTVAVDTTYALRFRIANSPADLEAQIGAGETVEYQDNPRTTTSAYPAIHTYVDGAENLTTGADPTWIDDLSVDDLGAAAPDQFVTVEIRAP